MGGGVEQSGRPHMSIRAEVITSHRKPVSVHGGRFRGNVGTGSYRCGHQVSVRGNLPEYTVVAPQKRSVAITRPVNIFVTSFALLPTLRICRHWQAESFLTTIVTRLC